MAGLWGLDGSTVISFESVILHCGSVPVGMGIMSVEVRGRVHPSRYAHHAKQPRIGPISTEK